MELNKTNKKCEKKKTCHLTAAQKIKILKKVDEALPIAVIAREHNLAATTIRRWLNGRQKLEECQIRGPRSKHIRTTANDELNKALYKWHQEMQSEGYLVSGPVLKEKALQLHKELGGAEKFVASDGWLEKWKFKYGLRHLPNLVEQELDDPPLNNEFKTNFESWIQIENLQPCQIFTAAETVLNYKLMPNRRFGIGTRAFVTGFKMDKQRITVMPCCNADGSFKLPLFVVGKYPKPRALKNISKNNLPVDYASQKIAYLTPDIFHTWFKEEFVPYVTCFLENKGLPPKAVLILESTPSHPSTEVFAIEEFIVIFLPTDEFSVIQPMDGIIAQIKKRYRLFFITSILDAQEKQKLLIDELNSITIKDVVGWLSEAWDDVSPSTIIKCWHSILSQQTPTNDVHSTQDVKTQTIVDLVQRLIGYENVPTGTIEDWLLNDEDFSSNSNEPSSEPSEPSAELAVSGLENAIRYLEQHSIIPGEDMNTLSRIKNQIQAAI